MARKSRKRGNPNRAPQGFRTRAKRALFGKIYTSK